jgi:hypothetical protein
VDTHLEEALHELQATHQHRFLAQRVRAPRAPCHQPQPQVGLHAVHVDGVFVNVHPGGGVVTPTVFPVAVCILLVLLPLLLVVVFVVHAVAHFALQLREHLVDVRHVQLLALARPPGIVAVPRPLQLRLLLVRQVLPFHVLAPGLGRQARNLGAQQGDGVADGLGFEHLVKVGRFVDECQRIRKDVVLASPTAAGATNAATAATTSILVAARL